MKTTKSQLRQIIKEELEVILTNEEAGELFGEGVEAQLEEQEVNEDMSALMANVTPDNLMIVANALLKMGVEIGLPLLVMILGRLGYEALASRLSSDPMARKDKNFLINFIQNELEGYKNVSEQMMEQEKIAGDVARVGKKLNTLTGFDKLLASINTRAEFEQLMMQFIQMVAKDKLKPNDVKLGVRNVTKAVLQGK